VTAHNEHKLAINIIGTLAGLGREPYA